MNLSGFDLVGDDLAHSHLLVDEKTATATFTSAPPKRKRKGVTILTSDEYRALRAAYLSAMAINP